MPLTNFHSSTPYTLGIEFELQLVNPPTYDLSQDASRLIASLSTPPECGEIKHDITESMLEIATGVCHSLDQARQQIHTLKQTVLHGADAMGLEVCGGGTHPFQRWQRQQVVETPRYRAQMERFGYLMQQSTVFGQHVHIGCENGDDAIYLIQELARFVPHLIALSGASPWFQGADSGFASARVNIFSAFPDNGPAPWATNWAEFNKIYQRLLLTGMIESLKDLHWDIRPSPKFGTVEVRVMDTPLTLGHGLDIAGMIQALACWILETRPGKAQKSQRLLYPFNRFQAARYGLSGTLTDSDSGLQTTIKRDLLTLVETLEPWARQCGSASALENIAHRLVRDESDADEMRAYMQHCSALTELVAHQVAVWAGE